MEKRNGLPFLAAGPPCPGGNPEPVEIDPLAVTGPARGEIHDQPARQSRDGRFAGDRSVYTVHDRNRSGRGKAAPAPSVPQRYRLKLGFFQRLMTPAMGM